MNRQLAIDSLSRQYLMTGQSGPQVFVVMQFVWVQTAMAWQTLDIPVPGRRYQDIPGRAAWEIPETGCRTGSTEDISRALIEAAGITPDQVIQALGSGRRICSGGETGYLTVVKPNQP